MATKSTTSSNSLLNPSSTLTALKRSHVQELGQIHDIKQSWRQPFHQQARFSSPCSLLSYIFTSLRSYLSTLLLSPSSILFDPLSTLATLVIYPIIFLRLTLTVIVFSVLAACGGDRLIHWVGDKYAKGYSMVNWPNPELLGGEESREAVEAAKATLGGLPTTFPDAPPPAVFGSDSAVDPSTLMTTRIFDLDVAKAFLIMSALVYERNDDQVREASRLAAIGDTLKAEALLSESEGVIRAQASAWGLRYSGVSDLSSTSGPFASIFYTPESDSNPFIVLCFKGTTPSNFAEFLIDATISRVSGSVFLGSDTTVHAGFYTDLFPTTEGGADGYGHITRALRLVSKEMTGGDVDKKIPLWVTGHSLGSALSSLFYARVLRMPQDLGPHIKLRDSYCFGTPRLGDGAFASAFEAVQITPLSRPNMLYRTINSHDVVTLVPPGLADKESRCSTLSSLSILNYAHIGTAFHLVDGEAPNYRVETGSLHEATRVVVVSERGGGRKRIGRRVSLGKKAKEGGNPLGWVFGLLPGPLFDHFPASYYTRLNQVQVMGQGGEKRKEAVARKGKGGVVSQAGARLFMMVE